MRREGSETELTEALEASLRADLAGDDRALSGVVPVLSHVLANPGEPMVSDDIVARMRGLMANVAQQLLASGDNADAPSPDEITSLSVALVRNGSVVTHFYALAFEGVLSEQLAQSQGLDPVMSPLIRELIGSKDKPVAEMAMALMASQARFIESQKRSHISLFELPPELFDDVLASAKAWAKQQIRPLAKGLDAQLRAQYDEGATRVGLLSRLINLLGASGELVCEMETAGPAVFCSAIAGETRQPRELIVLSCQPQQSLRLALALKACGISSESIVRQFEFIGSEVALPAGFEEWDNDSAADVLIGSPLGAKVVSNG